MTDTHNALDSYRTTLLANRIIVPANGYLTEVSIESTGTTFAKWILNGVEYTGKATKIDYQYNPAHVAWADARRKNGDLP